jgi:hypothetical protein
MNLERGYHMLTRICNKCKIEKSLDLFYNRKRDKLGKQTMCIECRKEDKRRFNKTSRRTGINNKKAISKNYQRKFLTTPRGRLFSILKRAKTRAKKNNLEFDIDLNWLMEQFEKQDGRCKLTKIKFIFEHNPNFENLSMPFSPSLDRIDSNKGYTKDNVRIICTIVNLGINHFGTETFKYVCQEFLKFN